MDAFSSSGSGVNANGLRIACSSAYKIAEAVSRSIRPARRGGGNGGSKSAERRPPRDVEDLARSGLERAERCSKAAVEKESVAGERGCAL
jgi:hypothetical protein